MLHGSKRILPAILFTVVLFGWANAPRAEAISPFSRVIGSWSGGGSVQLSNGTKERLRCRANYASQTAGAATLKLELRCASESYNFELASDLAYSGGEISGMWNEATRGISGNVSGTASGDRIRAVTQGPTFNATLEFTTRNDQQFIRLQSPGSEISEVSIAMSRRR
jgi:hypothetical protein